MLPICPMKSEKTHFWLFAQNIHHKLLVGTLLHSRQKFTKTVQVSLGFRRLKVFYLRLQWNLSYPSVSTSKMFSHSLKRAAKQWSKQFHSMEAQRRRKLLPFPTWQQRNFFKLNNPSREILEWTPDGNEEVGEEKFPVLSNANSPDNRYYQMALLKPLTQRE